MTSGQHEGRVFRWASSAFAQGCRLLECGLSEPPLLSAVLRCHRNETFCPHIRLPQVPVQERATGVCKGPAAGADCQQCVSAARQRQRSAA